MTVAVRPLLLALLVLCAAVAALAGSHWFSGPVVLTLTGSHGVHASDPLVAALAGLCVLGLLRQSQQGQGLPQHC